MDSIGGFFRNILDGAVLQTSAGFVATLLAVALAMFVLQVVYIFVFYGGIPRFRNNRNVEAGSVPPPISVIVVVREFSEFYITNHLPRLLEQQYHTFEVVVVDMSYSDEVRDMLADMAAVHPNMKTTRIRSDNHFEHSIKLAITVGIKAATYEHLLLTTQDSFPDSGKWLATMAKGFLTSRIVIGYCAVERLGGFANSMMRCSRLAAGIRYLSAAIHGRPYRGLAHNIGYTKEVYFGNKGFNYLNLNVGDEDLFVQKIVRNEPVSVVMNPHATVREQQIRGLEWWFGVRKYFSYAYRFYPGWVKWRTFGDLASRALLLASVVAMVVVMPLPLKIFALVLWVLRLILLEISVVRVGRRLGDHGLGWWYMLYDLVAPFSEAVLCISRRLSPNSGIWR